MYVYHMINMHRSAHVAHVMATRGARGTNSDPIIYLYKVILRSSTYVG